jgi:hypothetical protein
MLSQKREGRGVFKLLLVEREKLREVERKTTVSKEEMCPQRPEGHREQVQYITGSCLTRHNVMVAYVGSIAYIMNSKIRTKITDIFKKNIDGFFEVFLI